MSDGIFDIGESARMEAADWALAESMGPGVWDAYLGAQRRAGFGPTWHPGAIRSARMLMDSRLASHGPTGEVEAISEAQMWAYAMLVAAGGRP